MEKHMKLPTKSLAPVLLLAVLAVACGEKDEAPATQPAVVTTPPVAAPVAVEAAAPSAGGYEPTADERVPGITLPTDAVKAPAVSEAPVAEAPAAK